MTKELAVKEIVLQLGKKEVSLTIDQAKKLMELLNETFGKKVEHVHHHDTVYRDRYPYWNWPYNGVTFTCDSGTATYGEVTGQVTLSLQ